MTQVASIPLAPPLTNGLIAFQIVFFGAVSAVATSFALASSPAIGALSGFVAVTPAICTSILVLRAILVHGVRCSDRDWVPHAHGATLPAALMSHVKSCAYSLLSDPQATRSQLRCCT